MKLDIEPINYAEQLDLAELVGYPGQSRIRWQHAVTAASIRAIDGRETFAPTHPMHIRDVLAEVPSEEFRAANLQVHTYRGPVEQPPPDVTVAPLATIEVWDLSDYAGGFYDIAAWSGLATVACSVRSFRGSKLEFPQDLQALRERVKLLGWAGMDIASNLLSGQRREQEQEAKKAPAEGN